MAKAAVDTTPERAHPAARRKRRAILVGVALVIAIGAVAVYFLVQRFFLNNPPAPPPLGLTPQGSALILLARHRLAGSSDAPLAAPVLT